MGLLTNLISYWKMDESSGNRADSQGSNTLSEGSATVNNGTGIINSGAVFTNSSDWLQSASSDFSFHNHDFSFSLWVNFSSRAGSFLDLLYGQGSSAKSYRLYFTGAGVGDNRIQFGINDGLGDALNLADNSTFYGNGLWYHVVGIQDVVNQVLLLFVNGNGVDGGSIAGFSAGSSSNLVMGLSATATIDEVGIWNRVLTGTEITALYNSGAGLAFSAFGDVDPVQSGSYSTIM